MIIKEQLIVFIKSLAMGAVNAIPGVSGGTIAMITGIFERIINSLKSFDLTALNLLRKLKIRGFIEHTDCIFLGNVVLGNLVAIVSLAKLFKICLHDYPVLMWAYFFGLVFASVFVLGKTVKKWGCGNMAAFATGTAVAAWICIATPGVENTNFFYLMLCGAVAICCKVLPGTSGAFVLLLMGNYELVMVNAIDETRVAFTQLLTGHSHLREALHLARFDILGPFILGAIVGLLPFSHFLAWLLKKYHGVTTALLTGFILGSLGTLWPWKTTLPQAKGIPPRFEWHWPEINSQFAVAVFLCLLGILTIWLVELLAKKAKKI